MTSASVGFQCPECLAEGRKSQRTARSAYGGALVGNPALTTMTLIGINVAVWLAVVLSGASSSPLVARLALVPGGLCESRVNPSGYYAAAKQACLANTGSDGHWIPGVADGAYWQLITSTFLHVQIWHIASNMLALYVLGPQLERVLGRARFLALYLVSGLAGSALAFWFQGVHTEALGASGAIFGIFAGLAIIVHKVGGDLRQVLWLLGINVVITIAVPHVSWQAHLGGFVAGLALTGILVYAPRGPSRARLQWGGVAGVLALVLIAVAARSVVLA